MTPKSNDTELKKIDFSQKPMGVPPIPFWGLEMAKKGVSIAFLLSAVTKSEQFWVHFEWFLSLFQIFDVKQLLS